MIDINTILFNLDNIFVDVSTSEPVLICLPLINEEKKEDMSVFFRNIMFSSKFDQAENCDYIAKILNYLNINSSFSLNGFKQFLDDLKKDNSVIYSDKKSPNSFKPTEVKEKPEVKNIINPSSPVNQKNSPNNRNKEMDENKVFNEEKKNGGSLQGSSKINPKEKTTSNESEKISFFYLLQHCNKENIELYKKQKTTEKDTEKIKTKSNKLEKKEALKTASDISFCIPGQEDSFLCLDSNSTDDKDSSLYDSKEELIVNKDSVSKKQHKPNIIKSNLINSNIDFGDTVVLTGISEDTMVLDEVNKIIESERTFPYLLRKKNNEKIPIDKELYKIGQEKSYADYYIGDNPTISHGHACIISRGSKYFIVDTNSKNHTYVNGKMITSGSEIEIVDGTQIKLSNEEFEFIIC